MASTLSARRWSARAAPTEVRYARHEWGPFAPLPLPAHLPIAGELTYRYGPDEVVIERRPVRHRERTSRFGGTTA